MRPTLTGCHPAVAKTAKFFAGIRSAIDKAEKAAARSAVRGEPKVSWFLLPRTSYGRYTPDTDGCLRIAATLRNIDWILRFDDALLRALLATGCKVQAKHEQRSRWFEVQHDGEVVRLSFAEEYDKVLSAQRQASNLRCLAGCRGHKLQTSRLLQAEGRAADRQHEAMGWHGCGTREAAARDCTRHSGHASGPGRTAQDRRRGEGKPSACVKSGVQQSARLGSRPSKP